MKFFIYLLLPILLLSSCQPSKEKRITRKWQAIRIESPQLEEMIRQQRNFIDTVGRSTDPASNEMLYGVRNLDSMRIYLNTQLDSFLNMQQIAINNTWLDFRKDGTVITNFDFQTDTVKWYFDDDGNLMLDEMKQKGTGSKIKMEVVKLEDTILHLLFKENDFSSTAVFKPSE
jgi:hypothetical protein